MLNSCSRVCFFFFFFLPQCVKDDKWKKAKCSVVLLLIFDERPSAKTVSSLVYAGLSSGPFQKHTPTHTHTHSGTCMQTHTCAAGAAAALKRSLVSSCYANASKRLSENYIWIQWGFFSLLEMLSHKYWELSMASVRFTPWPCVLFSLTRRKLT